MSVDISASITSAMMKEFITEGDRRSERGRKCVCERVLEFIVLSIELYARDNTVTQILSVCEARGVRGMRVLSSNFVAGKPGGVMHSSIIQNPTSALHHFSANAVCACMFICIRSYADKYSQL